MSPLSRQRLEQLRNPEKHLARRALQYALKTGKVVKPNVCALCGKPDKLQAHHHRGYAEEFRLDVTWLCSPCHGLVSRKPKPPKPQPASEVSRVAAALGKLGGQSKSPAKVAAAKRNAKLGGRPKKKP
jgi:hypothetical protein